MKSKPHFKHDLYARNDPKLQEVLAAWGCAGIGAYWCIVEMLYEQNGYMGFDQCKGIAFNLHVQEEMITSIVQDFGLFEMDADRFYSQSMLGRIEQRQKVIESKRYAIKQRWGSKAKAGTETVKHESIEAPTPAPAPAHVEDDSPIEIEQVEVERHNWKAVIDAWNSICVSYPKLAKFSDKRKAKVAVRLKEMGGGDKAIEVCKAVFTKMEQSNFLKGDSRRGWKATFDWVMENSNNWVKIYEGNYDNGNTQKPNTTGSAADRGYQQRANEVAELIEELRSGSQW